MYQGPVRHPTTILPALAWYIISHEVGVSIVQYAFPIKVDWNDRIQFLFIFY